MSKEVDDIDRKIQQIADAFSKLSDTLERELAAIGFFMQDVEVKVNESGELAAKSHGNSQESIVTIRSILNRFENKTKRLEHEMAEIMQILETQKRIISLLERKHRGES